MRGGTYTYSLNDFVSIISFAKSYTIIRLYYHYSLFPTSVNVPLFPFKCELRYRPFSTLLLILIITLFYIGIFIKTVEISYVSQDGIQFDFDYLFNALWLVIITMTTVGYGDIYPQTHFGRFFGVISCLIGMILISYLVVSMNTVLEFTPQEAKAYGKLKNLSSAAQPKEKDARVIQAALLLKK